MALVDPSYNAIVTQDKCTIVTARTLTLTQDLKAPADCFQAPKTTDLEVLGDEVTIRGRIEARGKTIKIFARVLQLEGVDTQSGMQPAELNVDGKDGDPQVDQVALPEGKKGTSGYNDQIKPDPAKGSGWKGGGHGQSANDTEWAWVQGSTDPQWEGFQWVPENAWMHGKPGDPGERGGNGGTIVLLCDRFFPPNQPLILSAKGGRGGKGQRGQDGAKGGEGGDGSNAAGNIGFVNLGYKEATPGGNGGMGGNGGRGGQGGNGGHAGRVVFRSVNEKNLPGDKIQAIADRGLKGDPGEGGNAGAAGKGGRGGAAAGLITPPFGVVKTIPGLYNGNDSREGREGNVSGAEGSDGTDGNVELSYTDRYEKLSSAEKYGTIKSGLRNAFK